MTVIRYMSLISCQGYKVNIRLTIVFSIFFCRWMLHSVQTALHVLQVAMSYMLMLCVMSYNVWIFLGVLFGAGLGYFLAYPLIGRISTT